MDQIPFIHNYCDRWCERCSFTARCSVYASVESQPGHGDDSENLIRSLRNILEYAKLTLEEKCREYGIEITQSDLERAGREIETIERVIRSDNLSESARKYALEIKTIFGTEATWHAPDAEDPVIDEIISVISWYQFFIAAKIDRALLGATDDQGFEDKDEVNDPQSDANGSAKVALIAAERSILAWTYLLDTGNAQLIGPIIEQLDKMKHGLECKFPLAREFIRPGFDEIEAVM